jgi:hypothetical protein
MNVSVAPSSIALSQARPITIAVLAMGGQGGGVLVDWIVALADGAAGSRNRPRCPASPSAPAPRSITSR